MTVISLQALNYKHSQRCVRVSNGDQHQIIDRYRTLNCPLDTSDWTLILTGILQQISCLQSILMWAMFMNLPICDIYYSRVESSFIL